MKGGQTCRDGEKGQDLGLLAGSVSSGRGLGDFKVLGPGSWEDGVGGS